METIGEVLVADGDPSIRHLLEVVVRLVSRRAVAAGDGNSVLALLSDRSFDAVVMDLLLPEVSGTTVLERISRDRPELLPRVVLLTTAPPSVWERCPQAKSVGAVLRKPFALDELQKALRDCCDAKLAQS
jgi:CheY-like chemotaxis protein